MCRAHATVSPIVYSEKSYHDSGVILFRIITVHSGNVMLPAPLQNHWHTLQSTFTDHAARHEFDWPSFRDTLGPAQLDAIQRVLCLSDYVADSLPRDAAW